MMEKVSIFAGTAATRLGAIAVLWFVVVVAAYAMARWCIRQHVPWQKVVQWVSLAMGTVFISTAVLYFFPKEIIVPVTKIFVPYLICAAALHALLLGIDRYMRHKHGEGIIPTRLVVATFIVYLLALLFALALAKVTRLAALINVSDIAVNYLTRIAILSLLALEVVGGRCKDQSEDDTMTKDYTRRW